MQADDVTERPKEPTMPTERSGQRDTSEEGPASTEAVLAEHRRVQFAAAQTSRPIDAEIHIAEWVEFPRDVMSDR